VKKIVDPTGVGDAFRGGFLRGYELELDWQTCGQMGSLAAAIASNSAGRRIIRLQFRNLLSATGNILTTRTNWMFFYIYKPWRIREWQTMM